MIVTGEASGDLYGSMIAAEIKRIDPGVSLAGVGGRGMQDAGVEIVLDSTEMSVVGVWEALVRLPRLWQALNRIKREVLRRRPDLLILVDYPGMNLRVAESARRAGIRVMYYVSPQVWAWGGGRMGKIKRSVDKMVVILPFEVELYRKCGVDVVYTGHPLIDVVKTTVGRQEFLGRLGIGEGRRLISLLPGSRRHELRQHLTPLIGAARMLAEGHPERSFVMVTLPGLEAEVHEITRQAGVPIAVISDLRHEAIAYSDLAITCSGTVTLEAALLGTPMIVIYRLAFFSWMLGRLLVRVPYISLVNLVARERVVPELLQGEVTPENLAREAAAILEDAGKRRRMVDGLERVRSCLGPGGATRKAAEIALAMVTR